MHIPQTEYTQKPIKSSHEYILYVFLLLSVAITLPIEAVAAAIALINTLVTDLMISV